MVDDIRTFWEFFSYPILNIEELGVFYNILCAMIVIFSVVHLIREVYEKC